MKVFTGLLVIAVLTFSLSANAYKYLNPVTFLQIDWLQYIGLIIIHAALIWIIIAQYHMKQSWRIGIDEKNKTDLITNGLFGLSRNPIFLGMILSTIGIFSNHFGYNYLFYCSHILYRYTNSDTVRRRPSFKTTWYNLSGVIAVR